MGKLHGFNSIFAVRQVGLGAGGFDDIYSGGLDPNQEGGISTRRMYATQDLEQEPMGVLDGPAEETAANALPPFSELAAQVLDEQVPSTSSSRRPPTPPQPARGTRVYRPDTHLQPALKATKLIKNLSHGKRTRVHGRVLGWKFHCSDGGEPRKGRLA